MFRPLLWWFFASSLLFLWQYHRTLASKATIQFTISREGYTGQITHKATLNGLPYVAGQPCGVGWRKLVVEAEDAESFETNCFVWYAGQAFGAITLARTRGRVDLDFAPAVETVRITGLEETNTLENVTRKSLSLPTGRYSVDARFARFNIERIVEVTRNQTTRVAIAPSITTLSLSSEPEKAEFELNSIRPLEVSVKGSTPTTITGLPTGDYELSIARGDYRKNIPVKLREMDGTNSLKVEFRYAKLSISSEPTGAAIVRDGSKVIGETPASFDLQPGSYRLQIAKSGYFETNLTVTLSEVDSRTLSVTLANVSFVDAMERARSQSSGAFADYDRALSDIEKALQIKPNDENVLQLKRTIQVNRSLRNSRQFQRNRDFSKALAEADAALTLIPNHADALALKAELENSQRAAQEQQARVDQAAAAARADARRKHPENVFQGVVGQLRHQELFETQRMRCNGTLDTVRSAVMRALGRKPEWSASRDEKPDPDAVLITAATKGFGWKQNVVLVAGQVADNEVTVCFKLFGFILGENVQFSLSGISDESYKPAPPRDASARLSLAERNLARATQDFKKRLEEELR
jgi:tetratricopeptide (TPR) repeat protein